MADASSLADFIEKIRAGAVSQQELSRLKEFDLMGADLSGCNLSGIDLSHTNLFKANLQKAILFQANLTGAELTGANLTEANLTEANCTQAGLGHSNLLKANLFQTNFTEATITESTLSGADCRCSNFTKVRAHNTLFSEADYTNGIFYGADLTGAIVEHATFNGVDLRNSTLKNLQKYEKALWIGVDIRDVNFAGAYRLRRFISDQNYIEEFKNASKMHRCIYYIWSITSDCGRSIRRWTLLVICQLLFFAFIYTIVDMDFGEYETWLSPFYHSVATMTTLGYGDIIPKTVIAEIAVIIQVLSGYVMLGGLLALLTNKLARRAD